MRGKIGVNLCRPALIRIDDDLRIGGTGAHSLKTGHIVRRTKLDLQQRTMRMQCSLFAHFVGAIQRQGKGRDLGLRLGQPRQFPHTFARLLGLQIPQGTVHRIARSPGGQQIVQRLAGQGPA